MEQEGRRPDSTGCEAASRVCTGRSAVPIEKVLADPGPKQTVDVEGRRRCQKGSFPSGPNGSFFLVEKLGHSSGHVISSEIGHLDSCWYSGKIRARRSSFRQRGVPCSVDCKRVNGELTWLSVGHKRGMPRSKATGGRRVASKRNWKTMASELEGC